MLTEAKQHQEYVTSSTHVLHQTHTSMQGREMGGWDGIGWEHPQTTM